jgi:hypothetical protein
MTKATGIAKQALFQISWLFWTPEKRYSYLWQRTCARPCLGR